MLSSKVSRLARSGSDEHLCVTVRRNDHTVLSRLLAEGKLTATTLILDARSHERQQGLREEARAASRQLWLDTQGLELSLPSGVTDSHIELPWAKELRRTEALTTKQRRAAALSIVSFASEGQYSGILVPTHYLADEHTEWLEGDAAMASDLREALKSIGASQIELIYPLTLPTKHIGNAAFQRLLRRQMSTAPIDRVTLRIHPFGANAGPNVMRRLIDGLSELRQSELPLLVERAGFAGTMLFAMGVVDAVESGIAIGDAFDIGDRLRPAGMNGSGPTKRRIYLEALGHTVDVTAAIALMSTGQGKTRFACQDRKCCPDGAKDMLRDPRRHSLLARQRQLADLAAIPASQRAEFFVQRVLTPVCDSLSRASQTVPRFLEIHRRALSVKDTLKSVIAERQTKRLRGTASGPLQPVAQVLPFSSAQPKGRVE
jgi:hypothetical protein